MFKSIKGLVVVATLILAASAPSVAYARFFEYGPSTGSAPSSQVRASIAQLRTAAQQRRLNALQASVERRFASEGGWPTTADRASAASAGHPAAPLSQDGFHWRDAGIGAAVVLALLGIGVGAVVVVRRRVHQPVAS